MRATLGNLVAALRHPLGATGFFVVLWYLCLRLFLPTLGGWLAADDWFTVRKGLASSGGEISLYMTLSLLAVFCFLSYGEDRWQRFLEPIWRFLRWKHSTRNVTLCILPFLVGTLVFLGEAGGRDESVSTPLLHPTPPERFSKLQNPFRKPSEQMLIGFDEALRSGKIPADSSTEPEVVAYAEALRKDAGTPEARLAAFQRRAIEEGRVLFMINCRPCHGVRAMGDGPMSVGQRRQPADFTGVETIATLVEGAVFWRVNRGGIHLPREGAPWESAMPRWERDLSEEQIWKIIMAEYDIAGNMPREPENTGSHGSE